MASHLGLFCLPMSHKKDTKLILVNIAYYVPNFEEVEVEEAYWFGPVRLSLRPSVCPLHLHSVKNR